MSLAAVIQITLVFFRSEFTVHLKTVTVTSSVEAFAVICWTDELEVPAWRGLDFGTPIAFNNRLRQFRPFQQRFKYIALNHGISVLLVPIWFPVAAFILPCLLFWYLDRRRPASGACECGYDLTGNTSGCCPECGTPITATQPGPGNS